MHCSVSFTDLASLRSKEFLEQRIRCVQNWLKLWWHRILGGIFLCDTNSLKVQRCSSTAQRWPELSTQFCTEKWQQKEQATETIFRRANFWNYLHESIRFGKKNHKPLSQSSSYAVSKIAYFIIFNNSSALHHIISGSAALMEFQDCKSDSGLAWYIKSPC